MGVGVCAVVLLYLYRYARSEQGKKMYRELAHRVQKGGKWVDKWAEETRHRAMEVGAETADNISQKAHAEAERIRRHMNAVAVE